MSVLRSIESKIAGLVEGTFSRAFRSEVRPVEIARRLTREMEEHKSQSLSRTYVPNEYRVFLSPRDRERFADYEEALAAEMAGYLLEHARRERLALISRPVVEFETDDRLGLGEFGIQTRVVRPEQAEDVPADEPRAAARGVLGADDGLQHGGPGRRAAGGARPRSRQHTALLITDGRRLVVGAGGATIGRSRQCDVMLDDPNLSRAHAEVRPRGGSWVVTDLDSTNGSRLNGRRLERPRGAQARRRARVRHHPADLRAGVEAAVLAPVSVGLKFGFLIVLYLFLMWVAWSARARPAPRPRRGRAVRGSPPPDATGMYPAVSDFGGVERVRAAAARRARRRPRERGRLRPQRRRDARARRRRDPARGSVRILAPRPHLARRATCW